MTADPTAREIPADELAEAERPLSETVEDADLSAALACVEATGASSDIPAYVGIELYNALDERGRERDDARDDVARQQVVINALTANGNVLERARLRLRGERNAARAEVEREIERGNDLARQLNAAEGEVDRLRGQDETTTAIAALWGRIDHKLGGTREQLSELARLLDALARAHEEKDGGQDR